MKLTKFSVENYKVFKDIFTIEFLKDSIVILTGRNNVGKSTILEAINCFFQKAIKSNAIPRDCFSNPEKEIVLEAEFEIGDDIITIIKRYKEGIAPKFYDESGNEIKASHELRETLEQILENKPFYITPAMLPDDINDLIQNIYTEILKSNLETLEENEDNSENAGLAREYEQIKKSYPEFLRKLKVSTDKLLEKVSNDVSNSLQNLFSNEQLNLKVVGGESEGFSAADILKSTRSDVHISNHQNTNMPLSNQGTGLQRMSLIYLIQNMIEKKLMGENDNRLLLIDEPEAFLHPEAVRSLSRSLYKIGEKMPLMISTHSPILIDLSENHTSIQVFRVNEKEAIELYKSEREKFDDDDIRNMKILNYADSYVNEFFFANRIIIVEGDTEYIAFKHYAKLRNENLHIIRARGKDTIVTIMKILNQFNTQYDVLHDVDNHLKYELSTLRGQLTKCKKIFEHRASSDVRIFCSEPNFEKAIGIQDVTNDKKTETIYKILNEIDNDEYKIPRTIIENLFELIINRSEEKIENIGGFRTINSKQDYDDLFANIIKQKTDEEEVISN